MSFMLRCGAGASACPSFYMSQHLVWRTHFPLIPMCLSVIFQLCIHIQISLCFRRYTRLQPRLFGVKETRLKPRVPHGIETFPQGSTPAPACRVETFSTLL